MLLILSTSFDITTDLVIDWLYGMGVKYNRLNDVEFYQKASVQIWMKQKKIAFIVKGVNLNLDCNKIWLRRWGLTDMDFKLQEMDINAPLRALLKHCKQEFKVLTDVLFLKNKKKFCITNPNQYEVNKISTLLLAQKQGLKIPDFLISNNTADITHFRSKHGAIITKPLSQLVSFKHSNHFYSSYTSVVDSSFESANAPIGITFVQQKINKQYEVRVFYLLKKCYAMAIFSQFDEKTTIDFRSYNEDKPNRYVPYTLPEAICKRVITLMDTLRLDTGSLDFIVSTTGAFFFLEVNPVGQLGMLSFPCNYNLEKIIAEYLKNKIDDVK